jgi:hypothetical protein
MVMTAESEWTPWQPQNFSAIEPQCRKNIHCCRAPPQPVFHALDQDHYVVQMPFFLMALEMPS